MVAKHRSPPSTTGLEFEKGHPILDSIADGVFTVDRQFKITSFNRAAEEITGFSREEALGQPCSAVFNAGICRESCALRKTLTTGKRLINVPVTIRNKRGHEVPISISTAVLVDREGQPIGGVETFRDLSALTELRKQIDQSYGAQDIVGKHPKLQQILEILPDVAATDATVLIQGPSGSGKGLLAAAVHNLSRRRERPFSKVNCAALPETLLESELFGYVRGAFTDARRNAPGRIAAAEGGTLFLDEIGDVPLAVQVKLLRVVQEREYEPLGSSKTRHADVRVVAATNQDLLALIKTGRFREDLYYRLNVVSLHLPPLCERTDDIPRLVERFLVKLNAKMGRHVTRVAKEAMDALLAYPFPGNVRELENAIEHALVLCTGSVVELRHLPVALRAPQVEPAPHVAGSPIAAGEADAIRRTLADCGGRRDLAADRLGLHRTTLWRKMRRHGLDR